MMRGGSRHENLPAPADDLWADVAHALRAASARRIPGLVGAYAAPAKHLPDEEREASSLGVGGPEGTFWQLGLARGLRGKAAGLVRVLEANATDVASLPPDCGWRRHIDRRCVWRVIRVDDPTAFIAALARFPVRRVDLSAASDRALAATAMAAMAARGACIGRVERLDAQRLALDRHAPPRRRQPSPRVGLKALDLSANSLGRNTKAWVRSFCAPGQLRALALSATKLDARAASFLATDGYLGGLVGLDVSHNRLSAKHLMSLFQRDPPRNLRCVTLGGIDDLAAQACSLLSPQTLPALRAVRFGYGIDIHSVTELAEKGVFDRLKTIDLRDFAPETDGVDCLRAMRKPPGLHILLDPRTAR